ncbi:hypothetical protein Hanom_Chr15g01337411 [Helianthus anomalus]
MGGWGGLLVSCSSSCGSTVALVNWVGAGVGLHIFLLCYWAGGMMGWAGVIRGWWVATVPSPSWSYLVFVCAPPLLWTVGRLLFFFPSADALLWHVCGRHYGALGFFSVWGLHTSLGDIRKEGLGEKSFRLFPCLFCIPKPEPICCFSWPTNYLLLSFILYGDFGCKGWDRMKHRSCYSIVKDCMVFVAVGSMYWIQHRNRGGLLVNYRKSLLVWGLYLSLATVYGIVVSWWLQEMLLIWVHQCSKFLYMKRGVSGIIQHVKLKEFMYCQIMGTYESWKPHIRSMGRNLQRWKSSSKIMPLKECRGNMVKFMIGVSCLMDWDSWKHDTCNAKDKDFMVETAGDVKPWLAYCKGSMLLFIIRYCLMFRVLGAVASEVQVYEPMVQEYAVPGLYGGLSLSVKLCGCCGFLGAAIHLPGWPGSDPGVSKRSRAYLFGLRGPVCLFWDADQSTGPVIFMCLLNMPELIALCWMVWALHGPLSDSTTTTIIWVYDLIGEAVEHHRLISATNCRGPPLMYRPPSVYSSNSVRFVIHCKARVLCIPRVGLLVSYFWSPELVSGDEEGGMPPL